MKLLVTGGAGFIGSAVVTGRCVSAHLDIGLDWGLSGDAVLSEKDAAAPLLKDFDSPFVWNG